jgi:hypothetical protein
VSSINRSPRGLLGFLGIKNFGRSPASLSEVLLPTWDLEEIYLASEARWVTNTAAGIGVGNIIVHTPPQGTIWAVLQYGFYVDTGAGAAVNLNPCLIGNSTAQMALLGGATILGASAQIQAYAPFDHALYLSSGESLGISVVSVAGVSNVQTRVRYVQLDI